MTEFKTNKQYLKQTSPKKLKPPTPQQQALSEFIQKITQQGLKGQEFREARDNFISITFSSSAEEEIFQEKKEHEYFTRLEQKFDVAREFEKSPTKTKPVIAKNALAASFSAPKAHLQVDEIPHHRDNLIQNSVRPNNADISCFY